MQQYRKNLGKVSLTAEGVWNLNNSYDILSIVYDEHTQHGFISRKEVPTGVDLYNKEYWMPLNVSGYADNNIIILSNKTSDSYIKSYTIEEAINSIAPVGRRPGAILGFYNENNDRLDIGGRWELWQFNDTNVYNWENIDSWQNLYYNYNKFMGWFKDENFLTKYAPFPEIGCYAFVGSEFNEATVYRCDNKYVWNNTIQHAWDYVKVIVDGNVTVGENGNWFNNGEDTGIPASVKGENGKTPVFREKDNTIQYSFDNVNWITISDKIAPLFRWHATTGDTQANNVGRIQISRDNVTWTNLSGDIINNLHISRYIGADETLPTSGIAEGTIYAKGPYYDEGDTSNSNPIYRLWVYAWKGNTLAWQDNGEFTSIAAGVVQETGDNENAVMSQKAVTEELSELELGVGQYFHSKKIERIEKSPEDKSDGTYFNDKFTIKSVDRYAGLNFWVDKEDSLVYYVFNIKPKGALELDAIQWGARKYNKDKNTPSGLITSNDIIIKGDDGSFTIGLKIQNLERVEDAVIRLMFWGYIGDIHILSVKLFDEWSFNKCVSNFGYISETALLSKESEIAFKNDKYEEYIYPSVINTVSNVGDYYESNGEYSLSASIVNVNGYGNTYLGIHLPENYQYYIGAVIVGEGYDLTNQPTLRLTGGDKNDVLIHSDEIIAIGDKFLRLTFVSAKINPNSLDGVIKYPSKMYFYGNAEYVYNFKIYDIKAWAINGIRKKDFSYIKDSIVTAIRKGEKLVFTDFKIGTLTADKIKGFNPDVYNKSIVCWGSSSTAGGGWVAKLETLTGIKTYNGGVGGENLWTILGRIGSEPMRLNKSITIPATTTPVQLGVGTKPSSSILYVRGHKVTPLLQGDGLINPVIIDGIEGILDWTGSSHNDPNGYYTFTRSEEGKEKTTLPDEIVFSYGSRTMRNGIQILLLGYNGGYSSTEEYVEMVKRAKEFAYNGMCLIVGRHAAANKDDVDKIIAEEAAFKEEFGIMFVSSREYMVHRGLEDAGIEPTTQDLEDISNGIVPTSLRSDYAHFNAKGYEVYLNLIYTRLKSLGYV